MKKMILFAVATVASSVVLAQDLPKVGTLECNIAAVNKAGDVLDSREGVSFDLVDTVPARLNKVSGQVVIQNSAGSATVLVSQAKDRVTGQVGPIRLQMTAQGNPDVFEAKVSYSAGSENVQLNEKIGGNVSTTVEYISPDTGSKLERQPYMSVWCKVTSFNQMK